MIDILQTAWNHKVKLIKITVGNKYPNKKPGKDISKLEVQKIRIYTLYFLNPKRDIRELKLFQLFQFVSP